jgi:hypothetical protein
MKISFRCAAFPDLKAVFATLGKMKATSWRKAYGCKARVKEKQGRLQQALRKVKVLCIHSCCNIYLNLTRDGGNKANTKGPRSMLPEPGFESLEAPEAEYASLSSPQPGDENKKRNRPSYKSTLIQQHFGNEQVTSARGSISTGVKVLKR